MKESNDSALHRTGKNLVSGLMSGIANCLTGHPFDTLKVRLQTQPVKNPIYNGLTDCFLKTLRHEGIGGLYRGVGSPLVGQMFNRATLFTAYYQAELMIGKIDITGDHKQHAFICGAFAGVVASFVEGPIDLFKTKMQVQVFNQSTTQTVRFRHVFHAGWIISTQYGIKGVYQGLGATILRNTPSFSLYFGTYEFLKNYFAINGGVTITQQLICGAAAGINYWIFTFPLDVVKSSMQSDHSDCNKRKFKTVWDCATTLYKMEGGWRRFYRGYIPAIMRTVPASASMLLVVEKCREILG